MSALVDILDLAGSIDSSTPLLSAYETAISSRFNEIEEFEILSIAYTNTYDIYIGVLAGHTGWTESYLFTYIANEYNRSQGIQHKDSSPSDKHGIVGKNEWAEYDKTFPAYPCEGPCTDSFMTPTSDHEIKCGGPNDPSSSKVGGCGVRYYSCDTVNAAAHEPGTCMRQKWHQAWNRGPNGESVPVWTLVDCGEWTRSCFLHMGGHATPADPGNNNFSMMHSTQPIDDDDDDSTASLSPSGGAYTASAGSTHTANISVPAGFNSVYWYVKSPSESGLGTSVSYVSGDGSSTSASFSWSVPSGAASGDYVITAYTYLSDNSVVQPSYTVTVGSSTPSTPTDNTPDCSSCTDGCSACPSDDDSDDDGGGNSEGLYPTNGSYTLSSGDTHHATCVTSRPFIYVAWSVDGFLWETDDGGSYQTATESSFSYTFTEPGEYVISVAVQDGSYYTDSYTVTVQ